MRKQHRQVKHEAPLIAMEHHTGWIHPRRGVVEGLKQNPPGRLNHQLAVDLIETQGGSRLDGGSWNQKRRCRSLGVFRPG